MTTGPSTDGPDRTAAGGLVRAFPVPVLSTHDEFSAGQELVPPGEWTEGTFGHPTGLRMATPSLVQPEAPSGGRFIHPHSLMLLVTVIAIGGDN
jgi:hypothetical protein